MALTKVTNKLLCVKSKKQIISPLFFSMTLFSLFPFLPLPIPTPCPHFSLHFIVRVFSSKAQIRLCQSSAQNLSKASHLMQNSIQSSYFGLQGSRCFTPDYLSDLICYFFVTCSGPNTSPPCCSLSFAHVVFLEVSSLSI